MRHLALIAALLMVTACAGTEPAEPMLSGTAQDNPAAGAAGSFPPGSQAALQAEAGDTIYFAFDSNQIRPESQAVLRQQAAWLEQNPGVTVTVAGHADERGTREYNLALGDRRANAVRSYLIGLGVAASRVGTISYGEERPAVSGTGEQAWARNRRAVTTIGATS